MKTTFEINSAVGTLMAEKLYGLCYLSKAISEWLELVNTINNVFLGEQDPAAEEILQTYMCGLKTQLGIPQDSQCAMELTTDGKINLIVTEAENTSWGLEMGLDSRIHLHKDCVEPTEAEVSTPVSDPESFHATLQEVYGLWKGSKAKVAPPEVQAAWRDAFEGIEKPKEEAEEVVEPTEEVLEEETPPQEEVASSVHQEEEAISEEGAEEPVAPVEETSGVVVESDSLDKPQQEEVVEVSEEDASSKFEQLDQAAPNEEIKEGSYRSTERAFLDNTPLLSQEEVSEPTPAETPSKKKEKDPLPTLDVLKKMANEVGLDISHLGSKRRQILTLIEQAKNGIIPGNLRLVVGAKKADLPEKPKVTLVDLVNESTKEAKEEEVKTKRTGGILASIIQKGKTLDLKAVEEEMGEELDLEFDLEEFVEEQNLDDVEGDGDEDLDMDEDLNMDAEENDSEENEEEGDGDENPFDKLF